MINGTNGSERMLRGPSGQALLFETLTTVVFLAMLGTMAVTLSGIKSESPDIMIGRYEEP